MKLSGKIVSVRFSNLGASDKFQKNNDSRIPKIFDPKNFRNFVTLVVQK